VEYCITDHTEGKEAAYTASIPRVPKPEASQPSSAAAVAAAGELAEEREVEAR